MSVNNAHQGTRAVTAGPLHQRRFLPSFSVLRSFESAARHQSFTLAAQELHLTQSAISRQIKELEAAIGVDLFRRVGRRVELTASGEAFAAELAEDLERIRQTVLRAIAAGERSRILRIATLPTFASRWLIPRLRDFEARHPNIEINLAARLKPFSLAQERFDAAFHFGAEDWPDTTMDKLCDEIMVPVASLDFVKRHKIDAPAKLLTAPLLHLETRPAAWSDWFRLMDFDDVGALPGKYFDQFSMIIAGAVASLGAALLPSYLIEDELADGRLMEISSTYLSTPNSYYLVRPVGVENPDLDDFANWLQALMPSPLNQ